MNVTGAAGGSGIQTRIITSVAAIAPNQIRPMEATSVSTTSTVATAAVSMATVTTGTAIHLTAHQQTLLARVQGQLKALASNPSRTPEQEKFLHLLVQAQQQIHAQGRSQMQAAMAASAAGKTVTSSSKAVVSLTTTPIKATPSEPLLKFIIYLSILP